MLLLCAAVLVPEMAFASVESTLSTIQARLISTILPLAATIGIVMAAFSFVSGSPNARTHIWLAIVGCLIGFGAPSIIAFIRGMVQ